VTEESYVM